MSVEGRQAFEGGTSRISREAYVRICEGLGVNFPGATRPVPALDPPNVKGGSGSKRPDAPAARSKARSSGGPATGAPDAPGAVVATSRSGSARVDWRARLAADVLVGVALRPAGPEVEASPAAGQPPAARVAMARAPGESWAAGPQSSAQKAMGLLAAGVLAAEHGWLAGAASRDGAPTAGARPAVGWPPAARAEVEVAPAGLRVARPQRHAQGAVGLPASEARAAGRDQSSWDARPRSARRADEAGPERGCAVEAAGPGVALAWRSQAAPPSAFPLSPTPASGVAGAWRPPLASDCPLEAGCRGSPWGRSSRASQ